MGAFYVVDMPFTTRLQFEIPATPLRDSLLLFFAAFLLHFCTNHKGNPYQLMQSSILPAVLYSKHHHWSPPHCWTPPSPLPHPPLRAPPRAGPCPAALGTVCAWPSAGCCTITKSVACLVVAASMLACLLALFHTGCTTGRGEVYVVVPDAGGTSKKLLLALHLTHSPKSWSHLSTKAWEW